MRVVIPSGAALLAAVLCAPAAASAYQCEAEVASPSAANGTYRLLRDVSGGSMGNPAQRSVFELRDARTDAIIARCPHGFQWGRLVCFGRTLDGAADRFVLERESGRYALVRAGTGEERGRCARDRG